MAQISVERVDYQQALADLFSLLDNNGTPEGGTILPSRLSIINYVKAKLDELIPEGEGLTFNLSASPNISNPYDLLINAHLDEATKEVILTAPLSVLFPTAHSAATAIQIGTGKTGYIVLPSNFLRLSSFKMTEWSRDVTVPITPQHPQYKKQSNEFLRGGIVKPVAVLNWKNILNTTGGLLTVALREGGTGYAPGANTLTVVQTGGASGTINVTANGSGVITSVNSVTAAGTGYSVATNLSVTGGTGAGCKVDISAITVGYTTKRILEYYSVDTAHTIDKLNYLPETLAEDFVTVNPDLLPSLAWMCAAKILQIIRFFDGAKLAMDQVQLSYTNL